MAAPSDNIPDRVLNLIDTAAVGFIQNAFDNLWIAISVSFRGLLVLFLILYGLAIWRGLIKTPVQDIAWTGFKFAILYGLISSWPIFSVFIVNFVTNTPDALAGVVAGGGVTGQTASAATGEVYIAAIAAADQAMSQSGFFLPYILGGIIMLTSTLMVIYALFLIALSKIALAVLVGLGPLFILMMMFKATEKIFQAWLQQVINYMLIVVLTVGALGLMASISLSAVNLIPASGITLGDIVPSAVVFLIVFLLLTQVQSIAAALGGGIALTTQHVGAIAGYKASQAIGSGTRAAGKRLGPMAQRYGGAAFSAVKNRFARGTITPK